MPYSYFPATLYEEVLVTDILKKFKISDKTKKSIAVENYFVKDEDTPESIAYFLYGSPTYSWLVLMLNEIKDRNTEWPYNYNMMTKMLEEKYSSSSLFLFDSDINFVLSDVTRVEVGFDSYEVKSVDRNLNKVTLKETLPLSVTTGDTARFYKDNQLLKQTTLRRVVYEDVFSIHHFEDEDGNYIDPRSTVDSTPYQENLTYLYQYVNGFAEEYVVSNYDYENKINDDKRNIILLSSSYRNQVVSKISRMFERVDRNVNVISELEINDQLRDFE
jgi:hypothetical protein